MAMPFRHRADSERYIVSVVKPSDKSSLTAPRSKYPTLVKKLIRNVRSGIFFILTAVLGFLIAIGGAAPAHANPIADGFQRTFCSASLHDYDPAEKSLFRATTGDETRADATPYEKYGMAGMGFTSWDGPKKPSDLDGKGDFGGSSIVTFVGGEGTTDIDKVGDDIPSQNDAAALYPGFYQSPSGCVAFMDLGMSRIASAVMVGTGFSVFMSNTVYEMAHDASASFVTVAKDPIETAVTAMRDAIFFEFLTPVIMIGALVMAWNGLVKKSSIQAAQNALWMLVAAIASVFLMSAPMAIPTKANEIVSVVSGAGITAIANAGLEDEEDALCQVKISGLDTKSTVRQFQCVMWEQFAYRTWAIGQFNEDPKTATPDSKIRMGWDEAVSQGTIHGQPTITPVKEVNFSTEGHSPAGAGAQNWALYFLDNKVMLDGQGSGRTVEQKRALMNVTLAQLHAEDYNPTFKGQSSMNRLAYAVVGFLMAGAAGLFVLILSFGIIAMDFGLVLLMLLAPFICLMGVMPGTGRSIALGFIELMLGLVIKRVVLSFMLAVILFAFGIVFQFEGWIWSITGIIAVVILGIFGRKPVLNLFKLNLGGKDLTPNRNGPPSVGEKTAKAAVGTAIGYASGIKGRMASKSVNKATGEVLQKAGAGMAPSNVAKMAQRSKMAREAATASSTETASAGASAVIPTTVSTVPSVAPASTVPSVAPAIPGSADEHAVAPVVAPAPMATFEMPNQSAIKTSLKEAGYKPRIGFGTVAKASVRGAFTGVTTGSVKAAIASSSSTVKADTLKLEQRNNAALKHVAGGISAKRQEVEKANAVARAEAEKRQKEAAQAQAKLNAEAKRIEDQKARDAKAAADRQARTDERVAETAAKTKAAAEARVWEANEKSQIKVREKAQLTQMKPKRTPAAPAPKKPSQGVPPRPKQ